MKRLYDVVVPLVTPLTQNDRVDTASLESLTEYVISKNLDCLYPCGTTGEMAYLSVDERKLVTETVVKQAKNRVPVFAQVGGANTSETIELARHALECGADGIGVVTPWYFKLSDEALFQFYKAVADSLPKDYPVYLYSIPQNAVNDISRALAARIAAACPNVVGIKYSYPDMTKLQDFMTIPNFDVLVGPDHLYQVVMAAGGKGVVSGNAMIVAEHYEAITKAIHANDQETAVKVQRRTNILNGILCESNNIGCYKAMLKHMGVIETEKMRAPMVAVCGDEAKRLIARLDEMKFNQVIL